MGGHALHRPHRPGSVAHLQHIHSNICCSRMTCLLAGSFCATAAAVSIASISRGGCRKFVGQASAAKGKKGKGTGMNQKEQKTTLDDFRAARFNTLVATCIGEEGLDIPAVDLIVCLDVSASPTRSVQRTGRTGRHRSGRVVYILSKGKEQQQHTDSLQVCSPHIREPSLHACHACDSTRLV